MRKYFVVAALIVAGLFVGVQGAGAQSAILKLPVDSQHAVVIQRIGITDVTIDYHRPMVRGRKVFGPDTAQPYGKVWRAGANENTTIEFSTDVMIEDKPLAKGVYGLHMIPGESDWTVIFSKNSTSWGSFSYKQAEDALRVTVKAVPMELQEALVYDVDLVTADSAIIRMRWEKVSVPVRVSVDTPAIVRASLPDQLRGRASFDWSSFTEAAGYMLANKLNLDEALGMVSRSIQFEDRFENELLKSRILDAMNRKDDATVARNASFDLASQVRLQNYGRGLQLQGKQDEALEVFRANIKKDPNSWIAHNDLSRIAGAKGDFATAVKEMNLAVAVATDAQKPGLTALVKRLENKEDINK